MSALSLHGSAMCLLRVSYGSAVADPKQTLGGHKMQSHGFVSVSLGPVDTVLVQRDVVVNTITL